MRFWLWLTTGMVTKEWVAIHRKHHRFTDKPEDPHSPWVYGIWNVLIRGVLLYKKAAEDKQVVNQYGVGTPDDWIERNIYTKYSWLGILILLHINLFCFSLWGILIWLVQMIWIPFWAAGVINGLGHWIGYRNNDTNDKSKNIVPFGIIIGGEELHNNHHNNPASPKLSLKWWEIDLGYIWLRLFLLLRLAKLNNYGNQNI
jgi:stearoyl-CoA desaturase (delta-9 desaturase)